jgi:hypothetical protein
MPGGMGLLPHPVFLNFIPGGKKSTVKIPRIFDASGKPLLSF